MTNPGKESKLLPYQITDAAPISIGEGALKYGFEACPLLKVLKSHDDSVLCPEATLVLRDIGAKSGGMWFKEQSER